MNSVEPIRIFVVDDHMLIREGIAALLSAEPDMMLVGDADNGIAAIEAHRRLKPDLTLLDLQMPGMNGFETLASLRDIDAQAKVVILTTYFGDAQAARAVELGACGYLVKSCFRRELIQAIRTVHAGGRHISGEVATALVYARETERLNDKEINILRLISEGLGNRQIGQNLQMSEDSVKARLKNIFVKLDVTDRAHAVAVAMRRGMLDL